MSPLSTLMPGYYRYAEGEYAYRHSDGGLFVCYAQDIDDARRLRDRWLAAREEERMRNAPRCGTTADAIDREWEEIRYHIMRLPVDEHASAMLCDLRDVLRRFKEAFRKEDRRWTRGS